ncbi:RagB/SusD family nutrient uptake outer membrane protein [Chitinophagaceae bacterium LWZ2-11]
MKTIHKITFLLFALVPVLSCTKSLNKEPISTLTENDFYKTTDDIETQVIGTYASLQEVYNDDYILAGLRSDDAYISEADGNINQIDGFSEIATNSYVGQYWQDLYFAIKQANTVLKYLPVVTDSAKMKRFEAEAKFIRAHMYFNLVRLWGNVPLITSVVDYNDLTPRTDSNLVYNQIIADLQTAINQLPAIIADNTQAARVTTYAAKAMLAKVYLTRRNYPAARLLLQDLISNPGPYQLLPTFPGIFGINNEMNAEIIYAVRYKSNSNGLGETYTFNMSNVSGSPGFKAASDLRGGSLFVAADSIRKNTTFVTSTNSSGSISYFCGGKYLDNLAPKNDAGVDFIVLRYADVIMMYAEVVNEMDGPTSVALAQLNRIRQRANPAATTLTYLPTASAVNTQASFRTTIKAERRREFAEEDQRWYDLLRWGDAVTAMNTHFTSRGLSVVVQPYQVFYPIPQREIDISNHVITQNPGYR